MSFCQISALIKMDKTVDINRKSSQITLFSDSILRLLGCPKLTGGITIQIIRYLIPQFNGIRRGVFIRHVVGGTLRLRSVVVDGFQTTFLAVGGVVGRRRTSRMVTHCGVRLSVEDLMVECMLDR